MAKRSSSSKKAPPSRKEQRKQQRDQKKQRKKEHFVQGQQKTLTNSFDISRDKIAKRPRNDQLVMKTARLQLRDEEDGDISSSEDEKFLGSNKFSASVNAADDEEILSSDDEVVPGKQMPGAKSKLRSRASAKKGFQVDDFINADELEVMRLEKKLGLNNKKDKDTWKKLEKGLLSDGFDAEIMEFLREGEKVLAKEANRSKGGKLSRENDAQESESEDLEEEYEEQMDDSGASDNEPQSQDEDSEGEESGNFEEQDEESEESEDDFDDEDDRRSEEEIDPLASAPTSYLPSNNIYGEQSGDESLRAKAGVAVDRVLEIKVRSLLNRSSQENASHIVKELINLSEAFPIRMVLESVSRTILEGVSSITSLLFSSIAFALEMKRPNLISQMIEQVVLNLNSGKPEPSQLRLVANFCALGACSASLVLDIVQAIASQHQESPSPLNEETVVGIVEACGWKLRSADPAQFRQKMLELAEMFDSQRLEMHGKSKVDYSTEEERVKRWRKWLSKECKEGTSLPPPLTVPMVDFINAERNGRWWVLGASWSAAGKKGLGGGSDVGQVRTGAVQAKPSNPIAAAVKRASKEVINVALAQGMRTEVQKAVFCSIMTVEDYIQGFDQLLKLNLNGAGERDAVRVILHCCVRSKQYNPFFALLGARLCSFQARYRFSFQLAIWDKMEALGDGELSQPQILNFAKFVADLIAQFSLSLAIFKKWNFAKVTIREKLWFMRECLISLLVFSDDPNGQSQSWREGDLKVARLFSRLRSSKDGSAVRDGIMVLWSRTEPFMSASKTKDALLFRRLNVARRVMEHYVVSEDIDHGDNDGDNDAGDMDL